MRLIGALFLAAAFGLAACGAPAAAPPHAASPPPIVGTGPALHFTFEDATPGAPPLDAEKLRGRPAVIALLTTYDMASQAQARFLSIALARTRGRVRGAAILLEPPENRPLAAAFRDTLRLDYPVAIADAPTIAGRGPFGTLHSVPSILVLDAEGRLAWKRTSLTKDDELVDVLDRLR